MERAQAPAPSLFVMFGILSTVENTITYLKEVNLLRKDGPLCHGKEMRWQKESQRSDGYIWCCRNRRCRRRVSIRNSSFFEKSRLPLKSILAIIYMFAMDLQIKHVRSFMPDLARTTVTEWFKACRDVCTERLQRDPVVFSDILLPNEQNLLEVDDICTDTVEGLWSSAKGRIKRMNGVTKTMLPSVLDEFMYRKMYEQGGMMYGNLIADIAQQYNVNDK